MSVCLVSGRGAKWLCPSVEAVDNVINADIPYGLKDFRRTSVSLAEFPHRSMNLTDPVKDRGRLFRRRDVPPAI
jgi:hypothetical protein